MPGIGQPPRSRVAHSLTVRLGLFVILAEALVLAAIGFFYVERFASEADRGVLAAVQQPGLLMNRQLLRYESVADKAMMSELMGEEYVDGMVFGADGHIYYALDPANVGRMVREVLALPDGSAPQDLETPRAYRKQESGRSYLLSVTPIAAFAGAKPFFFTYVKVATDALEARKADIFRFFLLGSGACLVLTSLAILGLTDRLVIRPVRLLAQSADHVADGSLDEPLPAARNDEIGDLGRSFARMRDAIRSKIGELRQANETLVRLDELKSSFLSAVSHELRTPLTAILGFVRLIERDMDRHLHTLCEDNPQLKERCDRVRQNLSIISREGERLTRLINDLLDLTKIESGRVEWRDREIDPEPLLARVGEAAGGMFAQRPEVAFSVQTSGVLPRLFIDPDRLEQVLLNIISNAAKFTQEGSVQLMARPALDGHVRISVRDSGPGIQPEDQVRIFDKFHQVGQGDTLPRDAKGTGLGLSISRQIVRHYKGRIWVESEPGKGSTFHVELPGISPAPLG